MTFGPINSQTAFLPTYVDLQNNEEQMRIVLTTHLTEVSYGINIREIAQYEQLELLTGQQFFDSSNAQKKRYGYRKVFETGTIASAATKLIPHGLSPSIYTFIGGGVATDLPDFRPLPYPSVAGVGSTIDIRVDGTNIVIINGTGTSPNITYGIVILEYLKN